MSWESEQLERCRILWEQKGQQLYDTLSQFSLEFDNKKYPPTILDNLINTNEQNKQKGSSKNSSQKSYKGKD